MNSHNIKINEQFNWGAIQLLHLRLRDSPCSWRSVRCWLEFRSGWWRGRSWAALRQWTPSSKSLRELWRPHTPNYLCISSNSPRMQFLESLYPSSEWYVQGRWYQVCFSFRTKTSLSLCIYLYIKCLLISNKKEWNTELLKCILS